MKKMIRFTLSTIIVAVFALSFLSHQAFADSDKYRSVSIPTFKVQIQDMSVDSSYMEYPLIVYNDITYFPLTWNWCHKMSLSVAYTPEDGLYIANHDLYWEDPEKMDNGGYQAAGKIYAATMVDYPVVINGKKIDNQKEEYPLLNFRGITYFPLTWRFVVDEFDWYKTWDDVQGLKVTAWRDSEQCMEGPFQNVHYYVTGQREKGGYYIENVYDDYAVIEKNIENRLGRKNDHGCGSSFVSSKEEFYQLNYSDDSFTKIASDKTSDKPYNSGKIKVENASDSFVKDGTKVMYDGKVLYDLAADAGAKNTISKIFADKYKVNGLNIFLLTVFTTQNGQEIPAPYTPHYQYVFVDKGDGVMHRINEWRVDTSFSAVYNNGKDGFYLCSDLVPIATTHYSMERARVYDIDKNLNVEILNDKWKDWRSTEAIGSDKEHNLYLKNTWYAKENPDGDYREKQNLVSPINDGYFKLSPDGKLSKIYPYVDLQSEFVSPDGQIYASSYDFEERGFFHIQKAQWIKP